MQLDIVRCLCVTLCCLAAAGCRPRAANNNASAAKKQAAAEKKIVELKNALAPQAAKEPQPTWTVEGWGATEEDAKKYALTKARDKVRTLLNPPLEWTPPLDFVKKNLVTGEPQRCAEKDTQVNGEQLQCWTLMVTLPTKQVEVMRHEDAKYRAQLAVQARSATAETRMIELAKLTAWLVLGLAGVSLYIRLDRWTQGTRRRWLRLALTGVFAASGVGWWLLS